jgi:hypothetical protein
MEPPDEWDGIFSNSAMFRDMFPESVWEYEFAWLPHKCDVSGERIWLEYAYRGTRTIVHKCEPVNIRVWLTPVEYLIKKIKNEI